MTWTLIYSGDDTIDGPAVRGIPDEFAGAAAFFESMETSARAVVDQFDRITSDAGTPTLQGEAATALGGIVEDVRGTLDTLPRVAGEAASFLRGHVGPLDDLRQRSEDGVNSALARARTNWEELVTAYAQVLTAQGQVDKYDLWIRNSPPEGVDEQADANRRYWESRRDHHAGVRAGHVATVAERRVALDGIKAEWIELRLEEERLSDALDSAIDDIRLGDLSDPGFLEKVLGGLVDFVYSLPVIGDIVEAAVGMIRALANGNLGEFLWHLSDFLDGILTVLGTIALVIVLLSNPAGWVVALGAALTTVIAVLATTKAVVDTYLYASQTPGPDGETKTFRDVAIGAVTAGLAIFGAKGPGESAFGLISPTTRAATNAAMNANPIASGIKTGADIVGTALDAQTWSTEFYEFSTGPISTIMVTKSTELPIRTAEAAVDYLSPTGTLPDGVPFDFDLGLPDLDPSDLVPDPGFGLPVPVLVELDVPIVVPPVDAPPPAIPTIDIELPGSLVPEVGIPAVDLGDGPLPDVEIPDLDLPDALVGG